jgi:hypothetical protein
MNSRRRMGEEEEGLDKKENEKKLRLGVKKGEQRKSKRKTRTGKAQEEEEEENYEEEEKACLKWIIPSHEQITKSC